jgi:hypothetical protein
VLRSFVFATLAGAAFSAFAGTAFTICNESGRDVHQPFISPDTDTSWGSEMLAGQILPAGGSADIELNRYGSHCVFDIGVEDRTGDDQRCTGSTSAATTAWRSTDRPPDAIEASS